MGKKLEFSFFNFDEMIMLLPTFLVIFCSVKMGVDQNAFTLAGFAISCAIWLASSFIQKSNLSNMQTRFLELEFEGVKKILCKEIDEINQTIAEINKTRPALESLPEKLATLEKELLKNSEYMAKELGTLRNAIQIKQMGR